MTDNEIISRIIELESIITDRITNDRTFRSSDGDDYQPYREELKVLREKVKHVRMVRIHKDHILIQKNKGIFV